MLRGTYFLNEPNSAVDDSLEGVVLCNKNICLDKSSRTVLRKDLATVKTAGCVTLLCGGGSGHEPAHASFVGRGMLTAAVSGDIFASPPVNHILTALSAVYSLAGTIVIVKNYTGDRLNFGLAIEQFKIKEPAAKIEMILVEDDVATQNSPVGARGICGTVFFYKILGAMAEGGKSIDEIVQNADKLKKGIVSLAASLAHCCIPGQKMSETDGKTGGRTTETYEIGLGIHNEEGVERRSLESVSGIVIGMIQTITGGWNKTDSDRYTAVINNLGGLSQMEMNVIIKEVISGARELGLIIGNIFMGTFMTSLAMPGFSLTFIQSDDDVLRYLTADTGCLLWPKMWIVNQQPLCTLQVADADMSHQTAAESEFSTEKSEVLRTALRNACSAVIKGADRLNEIDSIAGDGDCGTTLKHLAEKIMASDNDLNFRSPARLFWRLANIAGNTGGTSGALYGILFGGFASKLTDINDPAQWSRALHGALETFIKYSRAKPGQKSMLDTLMALEQSMQPLCDQSPDMEKVIRLCVHNVGTAAENTKNMTATVGRESYSAKSATGIPDAGAYGVALWVKAIGETLLHA